MQPSNDDDLLQFKDYSNSSPSSPAQINITSSSSNKRERGDPLSELIYDMTNPSQAGSGTMNNQAGGGGGGGGAPEPGSAAGSKISFLTIEYYQQFFNVDAFIVIERIVNSMIPKRAGGNYLRSNIGQNPDLYGPFWINVTLVFCIAISGNIASYLQHADDNYHWRYNFHLVSYAATCIFIYVNLIPAALWALFKYSLKPVDVDLESDNADYTPSLLSLMCVYGYSIAIYIPVSILWVIQLSILQWILVVTAALASGSVLITVLTPALRNSKISLFLIIGILAAHFLLAAGFMLYFFHVPSSSNIVKSSLTPRHLETVTKAALNLVKMNYTGDIVNTA